MVDDMITLFSSSSAIFTTNGLGSLSDAISCMVTEERNGEFELELEYPITGIHYSDMHLRSIILAKPNPYATPQPFRVYAMSKPINGIVSINAHHISYDLSGYPVSKFTATSINTALVNMKSASVIECPFTFVTNAETVGDLAITKPNSIRSILGNEILDTYGGEYEFDKFAVKLHDQRGQNRGVSIRYGKNLTDITQEENCNAVYTAVYPFWFGSVDDGTETGTFIDMLLDLPEKIINCPGTYDFVRVYQLDLSSMWYELPTEEQIRTETNNFIANNNLGIPVVSINVSFVQLSQSEEYKNYASLDTVKLCDYVKVEFDKLGVSAVARCIKTVYNVLTNRYENLTLGEAKSNIASTISDGFKTATQKIEETDTKFTKEVDTIKIGLADINDAMIDKADIGVLEAGYAHITNGVIDNATIDTANVNNLDANYAHITNGVIDNATINTASIINLDTEYAQITNGEITNATIDVAKVQNLNTEYAHITNGVIDNATINNLDARNIDAASLTVDNASALIANIAKAIIGTSIVIDETSNMSRIQQLYANYANINTARIQNLTVINEAGQDSVFMANGILADGVVKANAIEVGAIEAEHLKVQTHMLK